CGDRDSFQHGMWLLLQKHENTKRTKTRKVFFVASWLRGLSCFPTLVQFRVFVLSARARRLRCAVGALEPLDRQPAVRHPQQRLLECVRRILRTSLIEEELAVQLA